MKNKYPSFIKDGVKVRVNKKITSDRLYNKIRIGEILKIVKVKKGNFIDGFFPVSTDGYYFKHHSFSFLAAGDTGWCKGENCGKCFWCCIGPINNWIKL